MPSLTKIAQYTKKSIKYGSIGILVIIILKLGFDIFIDYWEKAHPKPPPPPTVSFNKLPALNFPPTEQTFEVEYQLETSTGELPDLGTQSKVFLSFYKRPSLLAQEKAKNEAAKLGFMDKSKVITEEDLRWDKQTQVNQTLEMNIYSGAFSFYFDWQSHKEEILAAEPPESQEAVNQTKNFLKRIERLEKDLEQGRFETEYEQIKGLKLSPALSLSEANVTRVNIFRQNIDETPVVTADPQKGIVSLLFSGIASINQKIMEADFNYFPVNLEKIATYPIKTSAHSWEELKTGQAFISRWLPLEKNKKQVIIRKIYLAFYDTWEPQDYLQPVFVFEGDDQFQALLPAITPEWVASGDEQTPNQ